MGKKEVWIIRHGQSLANSGERTSDPSSIPLSPLGHQQAEQLREKVVHPPDLIVVSPFLRTQETSTPVRQKFPQTPVEEWPIQEFTYIEPSRCNNTTTEERRPLVLKYWERKDPYYQDGEHAESFAMLYDRVRTTFEKIKALDEDRFQYLVLFCHGQWMKAAQVYVAHPTLSVEAAMDLFIDKNFHEEVKNTQIDKYLIASNTITKLE